jgi:hypothetical protein
LPNYIDVTPSPRNYLSWQLLRNGIPPSLLCDLLDPDGPASREIYVYEEAEADVERTHPAGRSGDDDQVTIYSA